MMALALASIARAPSTLLALLYSTLSAVFVIFACVIRLYVYSYSSTRAKLADARSTNSRVRASLASAERIVSRISRSMVDTGRSFVMSFSTAAARSASSLIAWAALLAASAAASVSSASRRR